MKKAICLIGLILLLNGCAFLNSISDTIHFKKIMSGDARIAKGKVSVRLMSFKRDQSLCIDAFNKTGVTLTVNKYIVNKTDGTRMEIQAEHTPEIPHNTGLYSCPISFRSISELVQYGQVESFVVVYEEGEVVLKPLQ